ncbi:MAG: MoxR family ATPase [Blastocatellia bacterium]|nr:MoxR family ATPase [Blastocatellia bacterium]
MARHWEIFKAGQQPGDYFKDAPVAPLWRQFDGKIDPAYEQDPGGTTLEKRGGGFQTDEEGKMARMINAALCLRRPLLITGEPGTGKSSMIYAVAHQLQLGEVLKWPITSRSTLQQGLYQYDAIGRLQEVQLLTLEKREGGAQPKIGKYVTLGPLGTALLPVRRPRALLIDEIDKSDLDLPNDLLHVFEDGEFVIPELERLDDPEPVVVKDAHGRNVSIERGRIRCREFPFIIMTSNGEREFPAPFLRRCLRLDMPKPDETILTAIIEARLGSERMARRAKRLVADFLDRKQSKRLATDQLLNAVCLLKGAGGIPAENSEEYKDLLNALWRELSGTPTGPER